MQRAQLPPTPGSGYPNSLSPSADLVLGTLLILLAIGLTGCGHESPDRAALTFEVPPDSLSLPVEERSVGMLRYDADGRADTLYLQVDQAHTWRIAIDDILADIDHPADSLLLRMFVTGSDRDGGSYKEDIIRTLALSDLFDEEVVLTYNQPWPVKEAYPLRFEVDMSNQKVLGFFKPDEGDHVTVTGSWCGWCRQGVKLQQGDEGTWKAEVEVRVRPGSEVRWRYGIETERQAFLPNEGLEKKMRRLMLPEVPQARHELPTAWFNDQKRVVRVRAEAEPEVAGSLDPEVHLFYDGATNPARIEPMMPVSDANWEMAFMVPEETGRLRWRVLSAAQRQLLAEGEESELQDQGHVIRVNLDPVQSL